MVKKFTVEKGKTYEAKLRLTGWETAATNDMLRDKFVELGFSHVKVKGTDEVRFASGTWFHDDRTVPMPPQVIRAKEIVSTETVVAVTDAVPEAPKTEEAKAETTEETPPKEEEAPKEEEETEPKKKAKPYFTDEPPIGGFRYGENEDENE